MFKNRSFLVKMVNDKNAPEGEPVEEEIDLDAIRGHFQKYKYAYLSGAVAGITFLIMRGRYEALAPGGVYGPKTADTLVTMRPPFSSCNIAPVFNNTVNTAVNNGGHMRKIIRCLETDEMWPSMSLAAKSAGYSVQRLSDQIHGRTDHLDGLHYVIEGLAA